MPDDPSANNSGGLSSVLSGGNRRIDRVLSDGYLDGLTELPLAEVRELRNEAEQEEADLSYVRRLLQGRVDIIRAELARRRGEFGESESIIDQLPNILADDRGAARGLGRHTVIEPSRVDEHRRLVERLVADSDLSLPQIIALRDAIRVQLHRSLDDMLAEPTSEGLTMLDDLASQTISGCRVTNSIVVLPPEPEVSPAPKLEVVH